MIPVIVFLFGLNIGIYANDPYFCKNRFIDYNLTIDTLDYCADEYGFWMWGISKNNIKDRLDNVLASINDYCLDANKTHLVYCNNTINGIDIKILSNELKNCRTYHLTNNETSWVNYNKTITHGIQSNKTNSTEIISEMKTILMYFKEYCDPFRSFEFY